MTKLLGRSIIFNPKVVQDIIVAVATFIQSNLNLELLILTSLCATLNNETKYKEKLLVIFIP